VNNIDDPLATLEAMTKTEEIPNFAWLDWRDKDWAHSPAALVLIVVFWVVMSCDLYKTKINIFTTVNTSKLRQVSAYSTDAPQLWIQIHFNYFNNISHSVVTAVKCCSGLLHHLTSLCYFVFITLLRLLYICHILCFLLKQLLIWRVYGMTGTLNAAITTQP
jgi:hypothetical protein